MQTLCVHTVSPPRIAASTIELTCVLNLSCDEARAYIDPERYPQVTRDNQGFATSHATACPRTVANRRAAS